MAKRRKRYESGFKARVALEALKERDTKDWKYRTPWEVFQESLENSRSTNRRKSGHCVQL